MHKSVGQHSILQNDSSGHIADDDSTNESIAEANDSFNFDKEFRECIEVFYVKNKTREKYVRCKICISLPNIVRMNSDNPKTAPIATEIGIRYRRIYVSDHFQSKYHIACKKSIDAKVSSDANSSIKAHFEKADEKLTSHVTKLLFDIFVDAKKLTCSAYSWPARFVASEAGYSFKFDDANAPTINRESMNLQYVNLVQHSELLSIIVDSDKGNLRSKLKTSKAASIRIDGSVDRTQIDKIYVLLKIITADGEKELLFLGIAEQTSRGANGLFEAVKRAIIDNIGDEMYIAILLKISSICTDGTNVNSGDRAGLWALFEEEIRKIGSLSPFLKIWCSAHRMELVWEDVCGTHTIIGTILSKLSSISTHFHKSAIRTNALKQIATENNLHVTRLPKLFTIRWTEFSFSILNNFLRSWNVLMIYFDSGKETDAVDLGYFRYLSNIENLRITFLCDLLQIYSRYHKKTQDDNLTIFSLVQSIRSLENALVYLQEQPLLGGWEETLNKDLKMDEEENLTLKGFELTDSSGSRRPIDYDFSELRTDIIDSIISSLRQRFERDNLLMDTIEPFINFNKNADLRQIHKLFASDIDLSLLQLQFNELIDQKLPMKLNCNTGQIIKTLAQSPNAKEYDEITTTLSRIEACTPHSADVERCISANNRVKTPSRNRVSTQTENKYLYIYFNMPVLEKWDPRSAIKAWMDEKKRKDFSKIIQNKSTQAPYFKGVFEAEDVESKIIDDKPIVKKF